jgi:outer membrane protein OmpA-like peptidoglycan-associated protein
MKELNIKNDDESQWLPISDLMSVLMMVFLLIAVSYMLKVYQEKEKIEEVAIAYNKLQNELYDEISNEFSEDLKKWNAEIDKTSLSVRFKAPEILFSIGSSSMKSEFKTILNDFFPRFTEILYSDKYKNEIEEIRIEGHTSSYWS